METAMKDSRHSVMRMASVFSGIGGEMCAASMLGWNVLFFCEKNPFGHQVLKYWYPNAVDYEDITKTDFSEWRGRIDVLTGGFPCQPFSYAGKRRGADDDRYLWPFMYRAIDAIQPTWVVAENVAGILTMVEQGKVSPLGDEETLFAEGGDVHRYEYRGTFTLERICSDLESHGYSVQPVLIPACAVGAPHRRDRVFIVAHRNADDSDRGTDRREPGVVQSKGEEERLQKRHDIQQSVKSGEVRPEGAETSAYSPCGGAGTPGQSGCPAGDGRDENQQPCQRRAETERTDGRSAFLRDAADNYGHRGTEVHQYVQSKLSDGQESVRDGRQFNATYSKSECSERDRLEQPKTGREKQEQLRRRSGEGTDRGIAGCGRWDSFPTVSPVHRGNDGLPFPMDDLSISSGKWRTESLKAYGNAIVPQVMYEIFKAIEEVEKQN